ncbi:RHS repeat-associated core domain-containing protein [Paenimyroides ummariense]|uniref:RHS repeat-associated core domain-containing protein n=1 Tax=Paenimyroides ummariense TaxID=913024 RepID=A0A1I5F152_9FLAO|nr:DUF6443 domain-containing protein [Paenimyroides ummariense]SFO17484.1 RHS repeat-associated core domain-containing protein [Paenimyroides ummariense]
MNFIVYIMKVSSCLLQGIYHQNIVLFCFTVFCSFLGFSQSSNQNYIKTTTYKVASAAKLPAEPTQEQAAVGVVYHDGLGRPFQKVYKNQSNIKVITHIAYDGLGRQAKNYLPFLSLQQNLSYEADAENKTMVFYEGDWHINTEIPYSENTYENTPMHKVSKSASPGEGWETGSGHEIKFSYATNTSSEVTRFDVSLDSNLQPTLVQNGFYAAGSLYKNVVKDEDDHTQIEFKNKQGQILLKRQVSGNVNHDTYYVFDHYGNLSFVLPPMLSDKTSISNLDLAKLGYQYKYDNRRRLVEKKLPGVDWVYMIYDRRDRLTLVQDGNLRTSSNNFGTQGWLFTKYDVFDRPVYSGFYPNNTDRVALQNTLYSISGYTGNNEQITSSPFSASGVSVYHTNSSFPNANLTVLQINYYDKYPFDMPTIPSNSFGHPHITDDFTAQQNTKGLLLATYIRNVENNDWTRQYTRYDHKSRVITGRTVYQNGGYTHVDNKVDFRGVVLEDVVKHKRISSEAEISVGNKYVYDNNDQLKSHSQKINNGLEQRISENIYEELGLLSIKKVGGQIGATPLQTVRYSYNIRGWLTDINNYDYFTDNLYNQRIYYNNLKKSSLATGAPLNNRLFNGNISYSETITKSDNIRRGYKYQYDGLNRMTHADFFEGVFIPRTTPDGSFKEHLAYDKNGNITGIDRTGQKLPNGSILAIDVLNYIYDGNQVVRVTDDTNNPEGFKDGNHNGNAYSYDAMGNLKVDHNKGITDIKYNYLNLPMEIVLSTGKINYVYDASGARLKKIVTPLTGPVQTTDYLDGFQYLNGVLQFFPHKEGYVKKTDTGAYLYVFQYKDHLGNVRLSYGDVDADGSIDSSTEILEENNYYPFGLKHSGYNQVANTNRSESAEKYKFGGKEWNDELGLNLYDFGARNYDPALGRWFNVDPLADQTMEPYLYAGNNPIRYTDPTGMAKDDIIHINSEGYITKVVKAPGNHIVVNEKGEQLKFNDPNFDNQQLDKIIGSEDTRYTADWSGSDKTKLFTTFSNKQMSDTFNNIDVRGINNNYEIAKAVKWLGPPLHMSEDIYLGKLGVREGKFDFADDMATVTVRGGNANITNYNYPPDGSGGFIKFQNSNTLYNVYDAGNFMTGKAFNLIGVDLQRGLQGADLHSRATFMGADSKADQRAFTNGYNYKGIKWK